MLRVAVLLSSYWNNFFLTRFKSLFEAFIKLLGNRFFFFKIPNLRPRGTF